MKENTNTLATSVKSKRPPWIEKICIPTSAASEVHEEEWQSRLAEKMRTMRGGDLRQPPVSVKGEAITNHFAFHISPLGHGDFDNVPVEPSVKKNQSYSTANEADISTQESFVDADIKDSTTEEVEFAQPRTKAAAQSGDNYVLHS
ncbi:MAG TPA: hypothetical protein PLY93_13365, partial [Turneriella sp.]|nr:hypothetical protein [Turneriella sp.]